jgi:hypothetical protein
MRSSLCLGRVLQSLVDQRALHRWLGERGEVADFLWPLLSSFDSTRNYFNFEWNQQPADGRECDETSARMMQGQSIKHVAALDKDEDMENGIAGPLMAGSFACCCPLDVHFQKSIRCSSNMNKVGTAGHAKQTCRCGPPRGGKQLSASCV